MADKTTKPPEVDPVLDFMRMLWGVDESLQQLSRNMQASLGVTGPQRMVLKLVATQEGISANEISRLVHLHPSTISGVVKRLEAGGFLTRVPDKTDGRRFKLKVTPAAKKIVDRKSGTVESAVRALMEDVPTRDLNVVRKTMERLRAILQAQVNA